MIMFKIAAHRGGNSWSDLLISIEKGFDCVELDVHLSHDNYVLVQYSPKVHINGKVIYIQDLCYAQLSAAEKGDLLLLSDVLAFSKGKIDVVIDIKRGRDYYPQIGERVADIIGQFEMYNNTWVISFDHCCLIEAKRHDPFIKIALMYVARPYDEESYWKNANTDGIEVCNDYLDAEIAGKAHAFNIVLIGWCTKDFDEIDWLIDLGTDIITIELENCYLDYVKARRGD